LQSQLVHDLLHFFSAFIVDLRSSNFEDQSPNIHPFVTVESLEPVFSEPEVLAEGIFVCVCLKGDEHIGQGGLDVVEAIVAVNLSQHRVRRRGLCWSGYSDPVGNPGFVQKLGGI
jgi:hypothetical protein